MVRVSVGHGVPKLQVDAGLGEEELVVLPEPEPARGVRVEDGGLGGLAPAVSLHQGEVVGDEEVPVGQVEPVVEGGGGASGELVLLQGPGDELGAVPGLLCDALGANFAGPPRPPSPCWL